jgi:hypothetical protein
MLGNETYSKVSIGKHLFDSFLIQNGLKQEYTLSPLLFNFVLDYISILYIYGLFTKVSVIKLTVHEYDSNSDSVCIIIVHWTRL